MLRSSLVAVLFSSGVFAVKHYEITNACPSAITLFINGVSQGLVAINGTTTRDFEDDFSGVIYTNVNGGNPTGTPGTTRAGFVGVDNYYYIVADPLGVNAGVSIIPALGPSGGFCGNATCAGAGCSNTFAQPPTTFPPPQAGVPPAAPLSACPGANPGYTVIFCPTGNFPAAVAPHTIHPNGNANKCLEIRGDVRANGTPVQIFDCNGTPAQNWLINRGDTKVRINGTNFCLDAGATPANGVGMKIWTCFDNLAAQNWFYTGDNRIALTGQGQCLDLTNGALTNANQMQTWICTDLNTNQIWTI